MASSSTLVLRAALVAVLVACAPDRMSGGTTPWDGEAGDDGSDDTGADDAMIEGDASSEGGLTTGPPGDGSAQQLCVDTINMYRATLGLPALVRWTDAEACADGEAESDAQTQTPHGAFTSCNEYAQNECPGWPGPPFAMIEDCLAAMWSEGPGGGHYENMRGEYTVVACGFYAAPDGIWALQNFR